MPQLNGDILREVFYEIVKEDGNFENIDKFMMAGKEPFNLVLEKMEPSTVILPLEQEIKLYKADLEAMLLVENGVYNSPDYYLCKFSDIRYYIAFYPNGNQVQNRGQVWIFLHLRLGVAACIETDVNFSVESASIIKKKTSKYMKCKNPVGWGVPICTTADLFDATKNFMVYGELKIKLFGTFKVHFPAKQRYLISTEWKIKKSDVEAANSPENSMIASNGFNIYPSSDVKFCPRFFTNGYYGEHLEQAWIFVHLRREKTKIIDASLNFSIKSLNFSRNFVQTFTDNNKLWGFSICSTKDLYAPANQLFINGEFVVNIAGTLLIEKEKEPTTLTCEKGIVPKGYHRNRNFTFIIGEKSIKVHKHVLKAASTVFTAMFNSGMIEVKDKKMIIEDFEYEIVRAAMKLIYSSSIPTTFSYEQMLSLLHFADKYDIDLVKGLVEDYLILRISPTNLCDLITFTLTTVNAKKLQSKCKEYLVGYLKKEQPVYGYERLDKDFVHQAFMNAFTRPI